MGHLGTSPPLEGLAICAMICATVATFVGSWQARPRRVRRGPLRGLTAPGGVAIGAFYSTFVGSWAAGAPRADHLGTSPPPRGLAICATVA
eukprot:7232934-Pyramimonas_sp.AAC.1